ncbi:MAG TPA: permease, partial [Ignavibacteriaceae bacterium]
MKNKNALLFVLFLVWVLLYINLNLVADFIVYSLFRLEKDIHLTSAIWFFIYEVPKVLLLLVLVVFVVGIIRSYFSPERTRKILGTKSLFRGNILASSLGVVTPFCSCSAIPLFLGFVQSGIPLGVTFSFLISAPIVNEVALVLLFGLFGWKTAVLYASTGLIIATISGYTIGKLKLEKFVEAWVYEFKASNTDLTEEKLPFTDRIDSGITTVREIVAKVWLYIVIGIAVGAGIHGYVPENFMA